MLQNSNTAAFHSFLRLLPLRLFSLLIQSKGEKQEAESLVDGGTVLSVSVDGIACTANHQHRGNQFLCDQIIQDPVQMAVPEPRGFVFSPSVLQIQHRVGFL